MASGLFPSAVVDAFKGTVDYDTDTFYGMLVTSIYTPNFDTHDRRDDVTNEVAASGGYVAGGFVTSVTVNAYDTTNNRLDITFGGFAVGSSTITARGVAYYKRRGGVSSADELVAFDDFGTDIISSAGTFTVNPSTFRTSVN